MQCLRESVSPGLFRPLFGVLRPTLSTDQDGGPRSDLVVGSCCPRPGVGVQCQQRVRGSKTTVSRVSSQQSRCLSAEKYTQFDRIPGPSKQFSE